MASPLSRRAPGGSACRIISTPTDRRRPPCPLLRPLQNRFGDHKTALRILVAVTVVAMIVMNILANALPFFGRGTGEVSALYPTLVTPAGYVFAIWGLIYIALLAYSVAQFLQAARDRPAARRTRMAAHRVQRGQRRVAAPVAVPQHLLDRAGHARAAGFADRRLPHRSPRQAARTRRPWNAGRFAPRSACISAGYRSPRSPTYRPHSTPRTGAAGAFPPSGGA